MITDPETRDFIYAWFGAFALVSIMIILWLVTKGLR
jgi:hypothetical protein